MLPVDLNFEILGKKVHNDGSDEPKQAAHCGMALKCVVFDCIFSVYFTVLHVR